MKCGEDQRRTEACGGALNLGGVVAARIIFEPQLGRAKQYIIGCMADNSDLRR